MVPAHMATLRAGFLFYKESLRRAALGFGVQPTMDYAVLPNLA